jgi:hypothetical protein
MNADGIRVLLLGESTMGASLLLRRLEQRGCRCWFAVSSDQGRALSKQHAFQLVLSTGPLSRANLMMMLDDLDGTNCSVFATYPVEDGCLWLQLMENGGRCLGMPALRPSEFAVVLDHLLEKIDSERGVSAPIVPSALPRPVAIRASAKSKTGA